MPMPGACAFPRALRLVKPVEFKCVFAKSIRSMDPFFTVLARANQGDAARLGLAISKKNSRRAVDRHRIKRLVRESFRHNREQLQGLDVVVLSQGRATTTPNDALYRSLQAHWNQLLGR